jgi:hypothetical protein
MHDGHVGRDARRYRRSGGRRGRREGEDLACRDGTGGADRQDDLSEDGTPNSHDGPPCVNRGGQPASWSWRPPLTRQIVPINASLRLITEGSVRFSKNYHKM